MIVYILQLLCSMFIEQFKIFLKSNTCYVPVHFMYRAEFQLARASSTVQLYKYKSEAKRDCTPDKWSPSSEIYVNSRLPVPQFMDPTVLFINFKKSINIVFKRRLENVFSFSKKGLHLSILSKTWLCTF